jgi:AraC-like DNA-binding protein
VFCLVLFDGRLRAPALVAAVVASWLLLVVADKGYLFAPPAGDFLSSVQIGLGAALVLHAGWRVMRELRDDLVESRRRARPIFVLVLLAQLALDLAVDLGLGYAWRPASFLLWQNATIVALCAGLALWLLRAQSWLHATPVATRASSPPSAIERPDPELALLARIDALMRTERPYLQPELTIAQFAALAAVPEPVLRRAINHRLGHGHFRNFLNGYRVEEAKRRLRDPAAAGDKILAVALDAGFASLASFNRVFRTEVGCSPSEYRAGAAKTSDGADVAPE